MIPCGWLYSSPSPTIMKPNLRLHNRTLFLFVMILATTIRFSTVVCQETEHDDDPYNVCSQLIRCGSLLLDYPFWGLGRPAYCGHSHFQVTSCPHDSFILKYKSLEYRVLATDIGKQMITITRDDLWNLDICPQHLHNTSYNNTLFDAKYLSNVDLSLYYGCEASNWQGNRFSCSKNGTNNYGYFYRTSDIHIYVSEPECENHIIVPVKAADADILLTSNATQHDLTRLLRAGFDLRWRANNEECDKCVASGGFCGSDSTWPELFVCYCYTGNFSLDCNNGDENGECDQCKQSGGSCGYNSSLPELFVCYCDDGNFSLTCNNTHLNRAANNGPRKKVNMKRKLVTGLSCSIAGIMFLCFVILCWRKRLHETRKTENQQLEMFLRDYGTLAPKRYKYSEIKKMTNSFQEELGRGGYGSVYKGLTPDGQPVAVKLLVGATGDGEDFINEVASISRTSHVNIVALFGFCIEGKKRALVYEFMPNGSLDKFLHGDDSRLDWNTLFQIAKGIARGLEYLHRGCSTRIVHFDIKPHNILLDEEFVPKISDFGLAKLCKKKESIVSVMGARGTAGYMAPEVYFKSLGGASHKSDVYSYGMMVLEMTGASKNNNASPKSKSEAYFPDWIYNQVEAGDNLGVNGVTSEEEEELARKMVTVSLWCIQSGPSDRPSISKVVEMLEGSLESLQVPPRRFWSSPTRPAQDTSPLPTQSSSNRLSTVQSVVENFSS
ncbi:hypothetical protein OSB04_007245 [Centaurea solstitialis]|uniref:non-specific serine/threonine protein kinase n=1 Tax=Centaurea solstitialis TaxID=347529 RepID=A0AA38WQS1_9ASTR|nr:hypothetical protein OSB04_007245 [Centaurea solstitialis]